MPGCPLITCLQNTFSSKPYSATDAAPQRRGIDPLSPCACAWMLSHNRRASPMRHPYLPHCDSVIAHRDIGCREAKDGVLPAFSRMLPGRWGFRTQGRTLSWIRNDLGIRVDIMLSSELGIPHPSIEYTWRCGQSIDTCLQG
jgi:hypothetical protein